MQFKIIRVEKLKMKILIDLIYNKAKILFKNQNNILNQKKINFQYKIITLIILIILVIRNNLISQIIEKQESKKS
jgi:hypothetical protein